MLLLLIVLIGAGLAIGWTRLRRLETRVAQLEGELGSGRPDTAGADEWSPPVRPKVEAPPSPPTEEGPSPIEPGIETGDRRSLSGLFENLVAGRLLVWLGGAALVVAGIFLIRYTIEIGLVTPMLRMIAALLLGLVLIGAGEYARRDKLLAEDPRIAQALVGAGIAVLYATVYGSHALYSLIGGATAFMAMLVITSAALGLSLRHGAPTAIMGLIGGFLAPWLVGDPDSGAISLLAYLALLNLAFFLLAWKRGWTWLAAAAVALSFVWTALLLSGREPDALAAGLFIVLLAVASSLARPGKGTELRWIQPLAIGLVQLAALVARVDLGIEAWSLFTILSAASLVLAWLRPEYRFAPLVALGLALLLLLAKAVTGSDPLIPLVAPGLTILFGLSALGLAARQRRGLWALVGCAGFAGPFLIVRSAVPDLIDRTGWGLTALLLAAGPAILAALFRHRATAKAPANSAMLASGSAITALACAAAWDLVAADLIVIAWLSIAVGMAFLARRLDDLGLAMAALAAAILAVCRSLWMVPELSYALLTGLVGEPVLASDLPSALQALLLLALPALLLIASGTMLRAFALPARRAIPVVAGLFLVASAYVAFKQAFGLSSREDFALRGLVERTIVTQALFLCGWLLGSGRLRLKGLSADLVRLGGTAMTAIAAARLIWFDLLVHNPAWAAQWVGPVPIFNLILPAYLGSAAWLYSARRRTAAAGRSGFWLAAFLAALLAGIALWVRQFFQGPWLNGPHLPIAEFYVYSLAGLLVSIGLLLAGIRLADRALRLSGLFLLTATIVKVFLIDASQLEGLLRILSFLGLGIALIAIARLYGPVLRSGTDRSGPSAAGEKG